MVFQVLDDLSIANSALFPCLSVGEGPEHEVEGPLHRNLQYPDFLTFYLQICINSCTLQANNCFSV